MKLPVLNVTNDMNHLISYKIESPKNLTINYYTNFNFWSELFFIFCVFFKQNVSRHVSSLFRHFLENVLRCSAELEMQKFLENSTYKIPVPVPA